MTARPRFWTPVILVAFVVAALLFWRFRIIAPATVLVAPPSRSANTFNGDAYTQTLPMAAAIARAIRLDALPLWNPFQYAGHPLLATALHGALYPLNFPYLLLPIAIAIEVVVVMHLIAAGLFAFVYARQ